MLQDTTYRGYRIRYTLLGACFIERDGVLIGHAKDADHARRIIDGLYGIAAQIEGK